MIMTISLSPRSEEIRRPTLSAEFSQSVLNSDSDRGNELYSGTLGVAGFGTFSDHVAAISGEAKNAVMWVKSLALRTAHRAHDRTTLS